MGKSALPLTLTNRLRFVTPDSQVAHGISKIRFGVWGKPLFEMGSNISLDMAVPVEPLTWCIPGLLNGAEQSQQIGLAIEDQE
jgi:hypothetical protein